MRRFGFLVVILVTLNLVGAVAAHAHGSERRFGTTINGRVATAVEGDPKFALLALATAINHIDHEIQDGGSTALRERIRRLPAMARELVSRSEHLGPREREGIGLAAVAITEGSARLDRAIERGDEATLRQTTTALREHVAAVEHLVRAASH